MAVAPQTRAFLRYLHEHPELRARIKAAPDTTLLYAGQHAFGPAWKELQAERRKWPELRNKQILPDVLGLLRTPGAPHATLLAWLAALEPIEPKAQNAFIAWRAVSGIFAANAVGAVSFYVGSGITRATKVFAATEVGVLVRNPNLDEATRELIAYYQRCIASGQGAINVSVIHGA